MIAKHSAELSPHTGSGYPEPFRSRVLPREKRALGDAFGLDKIGVNLTRLPPGVESSMRHWHEQEDELIYVLDGELILRTEHGEERLHAGMCAGFKAGVANAHQLFNPGPATAVYLEISNRSAVGDHSHYPDVDLEYRRDAQGQTSYTHKDGTPY